MSRIQKIYIFFFCFLVLMFMLNVYLNDNLFEKIYVGFSLIFISYLIIFTKFNIFLKFYSVFFLFLFVSGILRGNFSSYLFFDLFSFSAPFFMLFKNRFSFFDFFGKVLPSIGIFVNILGLLFAFYHIYHFGLFFSSLDLGRGLDDPDLIIMSPKSYLYLSFFIYPLSNYIKDYRYLFFYNISMLFFIIFSLAMASRGTTVTGIMILLLTNFYKGEIKINFKFFSKYLKYLFLLFILFFFIIKIPVIEASIKYLEYRFFEETETLGSERTEEAIEVMSNLSFHELLFGRGFGASNTYWIFVDVPNGVNNVHYGWLFLVLKGGFIFLFFIYGFLIFSFFKLIRSVFLRPYSFVILAFLFMEFAHQNSGNFIVMVFIYISMIAGFNKQISLEN
jgi:hypothetical protein